MVYILTVNMDAQGKFHIPEIYALVFDNINISQNSFLDFILARTTFFFISSS